MAIEYIDDNTAKIPELRPNRDLINLRETFGVNPQFLLSDSNPYYTNMNDDIPEEGIASINTDLPIYTRDGDGNFLLYGGVDGTDGLIRNYKASTQNRTDNLTNPNMIQGLFNTGMSKIGITPQRNIGEMMESGEVDTRNFSSIPLGIGAGIARMLPDKYYDMSLADQVFTQSQMGYKGPTVFGEIGWYFRKR